MGRLNRERAARIRTGLELSEAKKRDLQAAIPCAGCGIPVPRRVLRDGHRDPTWCGVLVVAARDDPDAGEMTVCPACAELIELGAMHRNAPGSEPRLM